MPEAVIRAKMASVRRLVTLVALLLALLSVATALEALRAIRTWTQITVAEGPRAYVLTSEYGRFSLSDCDLFAVISRPLFNQDEAWPDRPWDLDAPGTMSVRRQALGFAYARGWTPIDPGPPIKSTWWMVVVPSWFPPLALAMLPAWWLPLTLRRWRAGRRLAAGRCGHCGYDLTANTSGLCPECGTRR